jgi:phage terminase large subunit-like protein
LAGTAAEQVIGINQGYVLSGAIKTAERKLAEGTLLHGGTALMAWSVGNARVEPKGNAMLITKQASGNAKIDPLMAMFDAVELMLRNPASSVSVYELMAEEEAFVGPMVPA